jgi:hypothetical protein
LVTGSVSACLLHSPACPIKENSKPAKTKERITPNKIKEMTDAKN